MSIFDVYDQEFTSLGKEINKNISDLRSYSDGDEDKSNRLMQQIEGRLVEAKNLIKQMEVDLRSQDAATRKALSEKVAHCKRTCTSLETDYSRAKDQAQKSSLIGSKSENQRQRLLNTTDKSYDQNQKLQGALSTLADTQDVGIEIMSELERNREKINSARGKASDFVGLTDSARKMLSSMENRDTQQKMVLGFIGVFLLISLILVIYFATQPTH